MSIQEQAAELLKERQDVKAAFEQTVSKPVVDEPAVEPHRTAWFNRYVVLLIALAALYYLLESNAFSLPVEYLPIAQQAVGGALLIALLLLAARMTEIYLIGRVGSVVDRYNLKHVLKLVIGLLIAIVIASVLSVNWYTVFASLGLVSLILGLALQNPLTSFFAWIYILARTPYRVGDRIKIGDAAGDVINVTYLDTTLWEFGGQYLSTDHPSGRIIKFPNATVFREPVYNYSWPLFPYIWNEIKFNIAYQSDLEFVAKVMQETAEEEMGEMMMERVKVYRDLLAQTPVDELQVQERPTVVFRIGDNTWLEAIVRYLVNPKETGRVKSRLLKKMLARLNAEPERVLFPKSNLR